ncbi:hypothetical protein H4R26_001810, partial [Coemansia thaxteri]
MLAFAAVIVFVPLATVAHLLVTSFRAGQTKSSTLSFGGLPESLLHSSWQAPFAYEAKVYASLDQQISNNSASFFERAQLLWHIEQQSVENTYPVFRRKVSVDIPHSLRLGADSNQTLYAHVFMQQVGQFTPHPNMSDPLLVSSKAVLVHWRGRSSDSSSSKAHATYDLKIKAELLSAGSVSWVTSFEQRAYALKKLPLYLYPRWSRTLDDGYTPPLVQNTITRSYPKETPLVALRDKRLAADIYQTTVDVDLEIQGIRMGWIEIKRKVERFFSLQSRRTADGSPGELKFHYNQNGTEWSTFYGDDSGTVPSNLVKRLGISALLALAVCSVAALATLPLYIRLAINLWSMPAARWIGFSRTTFSIMLISRVTITLYGVVALGVVGLAFTLDLLIMVYVAANTSDITLVPWVALSQLCRKIFRRNSHSAIANPSSVEQFELIEADKADSDSVSTNPASVSCFKRPGHVIATRRSVDEVAMRWLHLLSLPAIAAVGLYTLIEQRRELMIKAFTM